MLLRNRPDLYPDALSLVEASYNGEKDKTVQILIEVIPNMIRFLQKSNAKVFGLTEKLLISFFKLIDDDEYLNSQIIKIAASSDSRLRTFAAELIQYSKNPLKIRNAAYSLTIDRTLQVRSQIAASLEKANFDDRITKTLVVNLSRDAHPQVRNCIIPLFIKYSPEMIKEFNSFLASESTCKTALLYLKPMIIQHKFESLIDSFKVAMNIYPDEAVSAFINVAEEILKDEEDLFIEIALELKHNVKLVSSIHEIYPYLKRKDWISKVLTAEDDHKWRMKSIICQECVHMAPYLNEQLVPHAVRFSNDDVAIVRNLSVQLWIALFNQTNDILDDFKRLLKGGWQQRMVVAKVIASLGVTPRFVMFAETLCKDEVENVRSCLARLLVGTSEFEKYFGQISAIIHV